MLKYSRKLKPPQPMVQQVMFNYIQGGRHEIIEKDRYEDKEELTDHQKKIEEAKKKLQWRTPFVEQDNFWNSKFSLFTSDKTDLASADVIALLQTKFDFSWKSIKEKRERKRVTTAKFLQQFIPERHHILGNDLAAAHFICFRRGSVKYVYTIFNTFHTTILNHCLNNILGLTKNSCSIFVCKGLGRLFFKVRLFLL